MTFEGGETVATLEEVFKLAKDKIFINIEMKDPNVEETLAICAELIEKMDMFNQICMSSFDHRYYKALREMNLTDKIEFGFLLCPEEGDPLVVDVPNCTTNIPINAMCEEYVDDIRNSGMGVQCWIWKLKSEENAETYERIFDLKPDIICVDDAEMCRKQLNQWIEKNNL